MKTKNNIAIILAAGQGFRFDKEISKAFVKIAGEAVLVHAVRKIERHKDIDEIIIVTQKKLVNECRKLISEKKFKKVVKIVEGGESRQASSYLGLMACFGRNPFKVIIHDAARPFVSNTIISNIIKALDEFSAVDVAIPSPDTLIKVNDKRIIQEIPNRLYLLRGQTPQGFLFSTIIKAHELALEKDFTQTTDDCGLVLKYNLGKIYVVNGEEENIKITNPIDIHIADKIFQIQNINFQEIKNSLLSLRNRKVLIFGHNSGIGKEIYQICKKYKAKIKGYSLPEVDITDYQQVKKAIKEFVNEFGEIDIFISTAGILKMGKLINMSEDSIMKQILVNYVAQINLTKEIIPKMKKGGSIALFASSSYTRGRENYSIYSSTKSAIVNFVQAVSEEIIEDDIRINAICPARTNTPMREQNFGIESKKLLLNPKTVAMATLRTCLSDLTGQVININKK
jgi:2-C-methyl-D-erythritol 4-phosphate cytidylyltransferase